MKTIIVPTDFSDTARNAALYAINLAKQLGCKKIILYNAYQTPLVTDANMALIDAIDIEELKKFLHAFKEVCCGNSASSPISKMDNASRFRWLTATRSTIIQTSKVHPGFCDDPMEKLEKLHAELVGD